MVKTAILTGENETQRLRLLVLASKPMGQSPSQRFRLEQWAPRLARDHSIDLEFLPFESPELSAIINKPGRLGRKAALVFRDFLRRTGVFQRARAADAIIIHREASLIGPAIYERLLAMTGKPIIYDFDDSIWSPAQAMDNGLFSRLHFFGKTKTICRLANVVTPGNEFLAAYARRFNRNVSIIPTSIELNEYPLIRETEPDSPFTVCWTGSTSTLAHFEYARGVLEELARRIPLIVKVICNTPPKAPIAGAETRFVEWRADDEAQEVGACHAGIMPLPDNEATRGKCGLKALQYMATGRPVVVSPVGMNIDLIRDGENGFLAADDGVFLAALQALAASQNLRDRIGARARATIEKSYSAEAVSRSFAKVVRSVAA